MLSRRHLRIKVLQALYAFFQSGNDDLAQGEKQLLGSVTKLYELYIHQLSFLIKTIDFARNRIEESKHKFLPTEEDLNPNTRFIDNRFIRQLEANKDFGRWSRALKINWADETNLFHRIYNDLKTGQSYMKYMNARICGYKDDKEILSDIIIEFIANSELLRAYYEDRSIFWADEDFDTSIMMVIKTLKIFNESWGPDVPLPSMYKSANDDDPDEDRDFMITLFRQAIVHSKEYEQVIEVQVENWELDRIATMDIIILKMALAELVSFPSIPVKVTINEYIEISKSYSSFKSKMFINGILDKLVIKLKEEGKVKKVGRGLIE